MIPLHLDLTSFKCKCAQYSPQLELHETWKDLPLQDGTVVTVDVFVCPGCRGLVILPEDTFANFIAHGAEPARRETVADAMRLAAAAVHAYDKQLKFRMLCALITVTVLAVYVAACTLYHLTWYTAVSALPLALLVRHWLHKGISKLTGERRSVR